MKHLFVPYEIAKQLKEKGFNEPCFGLFNPIKELCFPNLHYGEWKSFHEQEDQRWITKAPTYQQVADWFREEKKMFILVSPVPVYNGKYGISYGREQLHGGYQPVFENGETYYGAYDAVIMEALKLI